MNILILTSTENRHAFVAYKIASEFQEDNISLIMEPKNSVGIKKSRFDRFLAAKNKVSFLKRYFINAIFFKSLSRVAKEKKESEDYFFDNSYRKKLNSLSLNTVEEVEHGYSINNLKYVKIMKDLAPDIILVMGTSLIKEDIIKLPSLGILNIHTGISPFYRGGMTNFWPFIYNELGYCGVTVHKLDIGIDSGDIIFHGVPDIETNDSYSSINCKSIKLGTSLMIDAVKDLKRGNLNAIKQWNDNECKLFFNKDYNGYFAHRYLKTHKDVLNKFLKDKVYPKKLILRDSHDN